PTATPTPTTTGTPTPAPTPTPIGGNPPTPKPPLTITHNSVTDNCVDVQQQGAWSCSFVDTAVWPFDAAAGMSLDLTASVAYTAQSYPIPGAAQALTLQYRLGGTTRSVAIGDGVSNPWSGTIAVPTSDDGHYFLQQSFYCDDGFEQGGGYAQPQGSPCWSGYFGISVTYMLAGLP
ncbi:MAG TPA: hypothetical protein VII30_09640, partial [Gemmatimonadaceae bacterium]